MYCSPSRSCAAARSENSNTGPANTPISTVIAARAVQVAIMPRAGGLGGRAVSVGASEASGPFQNASAQILVIEKRVSSPTAAAVTTIAHDSASTPAFSSTNFAKKPDSGGMPASENAATTKSAETKGALAYSEIRPGRTRLDVPRRRSATPAMKKRFAFTTMWWIT